MVFKHVLKVNFKNRYYILLTFLLLNTYEIVEKESFLFHNFLHTKKINTHKYIFSVF